MLLLIPLGSDVPSPLLSKRVILSGQSHLQPQSTGQKLVSCKSVGGVKRLHRFGKGRGGHHWIETLEKDIHTGP
jgi:hypothetical protein